MITAIGDTMRRAYELGWITTRDGNASLKRGSSDVCYITPSGWRKSIIHPEHMLKFVIKNGNAVFKKNTDSRPSGELEMHTLLLENATSTRAVLHLHPTHIIAAMYAGFDLQTLAAEFPETSRYTRVGPSVGVLPVTSTILAEETAKALDLTKTGDISFDIVGQKNHGVCAVGANPWEAFEHVERLNHICEIVLLSGVRP
ncbi:MAG: class II aldolase/adducin family protein [Pseudomonadota bacterium]|nr:class II aldolase/adducin family protein [Pseudomonadota bacterium]